MDESKSALGQLAAIGRAAQQPSPEMTRLAAGMRAAAEAFGAAYMPGIRRVMEAMRPLVEFANSPRGQAIIAAHEARKAAGLCCGEPCHCLCAQNHPGRSLCRGETPAAEIEVVMFGGVGVPMCSACAERITGAR